jgi:hypothetical protein
LSTLPNKTTRNKGTATISFMKFLTRDRYTVTISGVTFGVEDVEGEEWARSARPPTAASLEATPGTGHSAIKSAQNTLRSALCTKHHRPQNVQAGE